jgi:hypothetical protein
MKGPVFMLVALLSGFGSGAPARADATDPAPVRVGVTGAVSLPQPLLLGVRLKPDSAPDWESYFEGGWFRYGFGSDESSRTLSSTTVKGGVRYHPFSNAWFIASELGFRHMNVSVDISNLKLDGVAMAKSAELGFGTFFGGVSVGGEWSLTPGFALGFDLGVQLALLHAGSITIHAAPDQEGLSDNTVSDKKVMDRISGLPLPQIAVLRLVWYL